MNILVIEDDPIDRKLLSTLLRSDGYEVTVHELAETALEALKDLRPAAILLDLKLPGMDGLELARVVKASPGLRHIPIVALTAALEAFSQGMARAAGCDAFVEKPIDTRTLAQTVLGVIRTALPGPEDARPG